MKSHRYYLQALLALISGGILPLAFAPINGYPIAFISPALLLIVWLQSTPRQALWTGGLFGLGFFGVGASWVYVSIHQYGNAGVVLSLLITGLFIFILALFPATLGYVFRLLFRNKRKSLVTLFAFPALWVIWEWLRSWILTGFPWLLLGNTQTHSTLSGYAPLFGVYGLSLLITLISASLVLIFLHKDVKIKIISIIIVFGIFILGAALTPIPWTHARGKPLTVSLVQGNISQSIKWDRNQLLEILTVYKNETEKHWDSNLIVWPEAAIPAFPQQVPFYFELLSDQAEKHRTALILGAPLYDAKDKKVYNAMMVLGNGKGTYLKRRLVPFGEYTPLQNLFSGAMNYFNIPLSDLSPGPWRQPTLYASGIPFAPFICYEISYPIEVLNSIQDKQFIVVISDDSWFGRSFASAQQMQIAQLRAQETGRYVLYSANTGVTAIITPEGTIEKAAPKDIRTVLNGEFTPMQGKTPLMWWNYYPVLGMIILMLIFAFF